VMAVGGSVIGLCGGYLVVEVAEMVGFVCAAYLGGPFFRAFAPVDAFVLRGLAANAAEVAAVLGKCAEAKVVPAVIEAIVVDVVNDQMGRGGGDPAVHFDALAVLLSDSVVIIVRTLSKPGVAAQRRVIFGIDDGEAAARERYQALFAGGGDAGRIEAGAFVQR